MKTPVLTLVLALGTISLSALATERLNVGTHLQVQPNTELHAAACESILSNPRLRSLLPSELQVGDLDPLPHVPVLVTRAHFEKDYMNEEPNIGTTPESVEFSWGYSEYLRTTELFASVDAPHRRHEFQGTLTEIIALKTEEDFENWIVSKAQGRGRNADDHIKETWAGLKNFSVHVLTPNFIFPIEFNKKSTEGSRRGRRIVMTQNDLWEARVGDPIKNDSGFILSQPPKSSDFESSFSNLVRLSAEDLDQVPESIRKIKPNDIYQESLEQPFSTDLFLAFENDIDQNRTVSNRPKIYKILNPDNPIETMGYLVTYTITDELVHTNFEGLHRGHFSSSGDTYGMNTPSRSESTTSYEHRLVFDALGNRVNTGRETNQNLYDGSRFIESMMMHSSERIKMPVYAPNPQRLSTGNNDVRHQMYWEKLLVYLEDNIGSKHSVHHTETNLDNILAILEEKSQGWSAFEKKGLQQLKAWLATSDSIQAVARVVEHRGKHETEILDDHFLFVGDDYYFYFRL